MAKMPEYNEDDVARVRVALGKPAQSARTGVSGGTHAYGYVTDEGQCYKAGPSCAGMTTGVCHDRYICVPCLHAHKADLDRDGVAMNFVGHTILPDGVI